MTEQSLPDMDIETVECIGSNEKALIGQVGADGTVVVCFVCDRALTVHDLSKPQVIPSHSYVILKPSWYKG